MAAKPKTPAKKATESVVYTMSIETSDFNEKIKESTDLVEKLNAAIEKVKANKI